MAATATESSANPWVEGEHEQQSSSDEAQTSRPASSDIEVAPRLQPHQEHQEHQEVSMSSPPISPLVDLPPTYTASPSASIPSRPRPTRTTALVPLLPNIETGLYSIPQFEVSADLTTQRIKDPSLVDSAVLYQFISSQAALPPKPTIRVLGEHRGYSETTVDFDLRMNMMPFLIRPANDRWDYVKLTRPPHMGPAVPTSQIPGDHKVQGSTTGLDEYIRAFCADPTSKKTFTLRREVLNWDASYIEGQIQNLVSKLGYKGTVTVTHPTLYTKVVVQVESTAQTDPSKKKGLFGSLFEKVAPVKDYPVVKAVWPYASCSPDAVVEYADEEGLEPRKCAVMSEIAWWHTWKTAISNCIVSQRRGWISAEDQLEAQMGFKPQLPKAAQEGSWGKNAY